MARLDQPFGHQRIDRGSVARVLIARPLVASDKDLTLRILYAPCSWLAKSEKIDLEDQRESRWPQKDSRFPADIKGQSHLEVAPPKSLQNQVLDGGHPGTRVSEAEGFVWGLV